MMILHISSWKFVVVALSCLSVALVMAVLLFRLRRRWHTSEMEKARYSEELGVKESAFATEKSKIENEYTKSLETKDREQAEQLAKSELGRRELLKEHADAVKDLNRQRLEALENLTSLHNKHLKEELACIDDTHVQTIHNIRAEEARQRGELVSRLEKVHADELSRHRHEATSARLELVVNLAKDFATVLAASQEDISGTYEKLRELMSSECTSIINKERAAEKGDGGNCVICLERPKKYIILPCG